MASTLRFDETDCSIVRTLLENARTTRREMAAQTHLSETQVARRLAKIEQAGVISGYWTSFDIQALGLHVVAFVSLTVDYARTSRETVEAAIRAMPEVFNGYRTAGDANYIISSLIPDLPAFERLLDRLRAIEGLSIVGSSLLLKWLKSFSTMKLPFRTLVSPSYVPPSHTESKQKPSTASGGRPDPAPPGPLSVHLPHSAVDEMDLSIVRTLASNARISMVDLGRHVGLSTGACSRRVRALEQRGVVQVYRASLNFEAVGLGVTTFIEVRFDVKNIALRNEFEARLLREPHVYTAGRMYGRSDYLIRLVVEDLARCDSLLSELVLRSHGVTSVRMLPVLSMFQQRS